MRKVLSFLLLLALLACSRYPLPNSDTNIDKLENDLVSAPLTKTAQDGYVYYEPLDAWIEKSPTFFELDSVQSLFDHYRIVSGKQTIVLQPTHKAIVVSSNDYELFKGLLEDKSLKITIVPFGYSYVGSAATITENNPTMSSDCIGGNGGCLAHSDSSRRRCVPLYVLWPIGREFPGNMPYEVVFDVCIPTFYSGDEDYMDEALEKEVIASLSGKTNDDLPSRESTRRKHGRIFVFDNSVPVYYLLRRERVRFQKGLNLEYVTVNDNGWFTVPSWVDSLTSVNVALESQAFRVGLEYIPMAVHKNLGKFGNLWGSIPDKDFYLSREYEYDIYRAADYYFNATNALLDSIAHHDDVYSMINICSHQASCGPDSEIGSFVIDPIPPVIHIYQFSSSSSDIIAVVLHELGHASHYAEVGNSILNVNSFIKESFASFLGWYLTRDYYVLDLNQTTIQESLHINDNQEWTRSLNGTLQFNYSPFFVDLYDNFNQHSVNTSYVDDKICELPLSYILNVALTSNDLYDSYSILHQGLGTIFDYNDFWDFMLYFL